MGKFVAVLGLVFICISALAGDGFWETNGPYGGWMDTVEYDCGTEGLCYTAGNNGVFRSENGGVTWEWCVPDLPPAYDYITSYRFHASEALSGLIFADLGGLVGPSFFRSEDGGLTWEGLSTPFDAIGYVEGIACDARDPDHLCVAATMDYPNGQIFRSKDRGETWRSIFYGDSPDCVCISPTDSDVIWTSSYTEGPKRTTDGGETWQSMTNGLFDYGFADGIYMSSAKPGDAFMCDYYLCHWSDREQAWENYGIQANCLSFFGGDPSLAYACGYRTIHYSDDCWSSWNSRSGGSSQLGIDVSPFDSNEVLLCGMSGISRSTDGCRDISRSESGLCARYIYDLILCRSDENILVCSGPGTLARSVNGAPWENREDLVGDAVSIYFDGNPIAQDPLNPMKIYVCLEESGMIYGSEDGGDEWHRVSFAPSSDYIEDIAIDPNDGQKIYLAGGDGWIFRSENGGEDWTKLTVYTPTGSYDYTTSVSVDPADSNLVFVCSGYSGLFLSFDGGETFDAVSTLRIEPTFIQFDPSNPRVVYAGDAYGGGLFRSKNGAETWDRIEAPIYMIFSMAVNPENSEEFYISGLEGVHHTLDGGETWISLSKQGLKCPSTTALLVEFGEDGNKIYAAGTAVFTYFDPHQPFLSISTPDTRYSTGETLRIAMDIDNPGGDVLADLAVAIALPDGTLIYLPSLWIEYSPFYSGWIPGGFTLSDYTLLEAPIDSGIPSGIYAAYAALLEQGTMNYVSNLATCQFRVTIDGD
ncbi:MAG: hypothetical protein JW941_07600 [Candidatus Coatesbacteria bacterium]|nr:hypothetical protein [Candidatus Coatesbacteria bacterium]